MYAVSYSLAHRGPGATRARARWQPYASPSPSVSSSRPPAASNYLNTPASSVSSSPPTSIHVSSICEFQTLPKNINPNPPTISQAPKELHFRDTQKGKYLTSLVDQAVKSLGEIWHPSDIPVVFQTTARVPFCAPPSTAQPETFNPKIQSHPQSHQHHTHNVQLLSPVSPTTPYSPSSQCSTSALSDQPSGGPTGAAQLLKSAHTQNNLAPLKTFVHEVLKRSRTSGCVLQTALCYLEAMRGKVPELARKERSSEGVRGEPESASRIILAEEEDLVSLEQTLSNISQCISPADSSNEDTDTDMRQQSQATAGRSTYQEMQATAPAMDDGQQKKPRGPSAPLEPMPSLPSPLLCPRRTFLASLILASKFMQDKCYSNRAWAKLSGLHPREIGRCERALGEALEWRLWVGKMPSSRAVTRCKSEADLLVPTSSAEEGGFLAARSEPASARPNMLRRSSTVPVLPSGGFGGVGEQPAYASSMIVDPQPAALGFSSQDFARTSSLSALFLEGGSSSSLSSMDVCRTSSSASLLTAPVNTYANTYRAYANVCPPTPTLTYSPTSTASSSSSSDGDRTIQMTNLPDSDVPTPLLQFPPLLGGGFDVAKNVQSSFGYGAPMPVVVNGSQPQVEVSMPWPQFGGYSASMAPTGAYGYASGGPLYRE